MNLNLVEPADDLIEILADRLIGEGEKLKDCLVIFPGIRPVYFLRRKLAEKKGGAMAAPAMYAIDGFVSAVYAAEGPERRNAGSFDILHILLQQLKNSFCRVLNIGSDSAGMDFLLPMALSLSEEMEELKKELITPEQIAAYDGMFREELLREFAADITESASRVTDSNENIHDGFTEKIKNFSALYRQFYESADMEGFVTAAGQMAWTAGFLNPEYIKRHYHRIFVAGFLRMTKAEQKISECLDKAGAEFFFIKNPLLTRYLSGIRPEDVYVREPEGEINFYRAADMHGEIYRLASLLDSSVPALQPDAEKTVIVLPDTHTLFPLLLNCLPENTVCNVSMACPIAVSPVYSLYTALSALFVMKPEYGYDVFSYLGFLKHPYIKNLSCSGTAENGRIVIQALERNLAGSLRRSFNPCEPSGINVPQLSTESAEDHLRSIYEICVRPFEHIDNLAYFCRSLRAVFTHIAENSTASRHPYWSEFQAALFSLMEELENSGLASEKFNDTPSYFRFFGLALSKSGYPFSGTPVKGIQILGPIETRSINFDTVYFLDANADVLPPSGRKAKIISDFLRKQIGLATRRDREAESRYHFESLISGARNVNIFYRDAAEKEKSPFIEKLIWLKQQKHEKVVEEPAFFTPSFELSHAGEVQKTAGIMKKLEKFVFSPSSVDTYLHCGLNFFYSYVLRLKEGERLSRVLEQSDIGSMVHTVLEKFFSEKQNGPLEIYDSDLDRMKIIAEEILNSRFGSTGSGFPYIFKRQLFLRFPGILDYHRTIAGNTEILKLETKLELPVRYKDHGYVRMAGYADRIDRRDGKIFIVDYKTGTEADVPDLLKFDPANRGEWRKTLKSVQLPFYLQAYMHKYGIEYGEENFPMADAALMFLGTTPVKEKRLFGQLEKKLKEKHKNGVKSVPAQTTDLAMSGLSSAINMLIEEILNPDIPFSPAEDEDRCRNCRFAVACGRI